MPTLTPVGMVTDFVNEPALFTVASARPWLPSKIMATVVLGGNPDPVTVTFVPDGPLVGDIDIVPTALALSNPMNVLAIRIEIINKEKYLFIAIP